MEQLRPRNKVYSVLSDLLAVVCIVLFYNTFFSVRAILSRNGVYYDEDSTGFKSPTLTEFTCYRELDGIRFEGPSIVGTLLKVEKPKTNANGVFSFTVRSKTNKTYYVEIELAPKPEGDRAFHVINAQSSMLNINYPQEGIYGTP